jgi:SagB-type dehydrogenase family enzyme
MPRRKEADVARLYHLHSSNVRCRVPELTVDTDGRPVRFRTYAGSRRVDLPERDFALDARLGEVLQRRRSARKFVLGSLRLDVLGRLLHASYGLRGYRRVEGQWTYDRSSPSAGGLYPLEVYVATQSVEGLSNGIYHYDARAHQLELIRSGLFHPHIADMTIGQEMIRDANLVVLISALFERTMWKYGQRGYRYVWLDAGHLGQNLYLVAVALGLGPVAIGGFFDDELNALLRLPDGEEVIYLVCVGQPADELVGD